MIMIFIIIIIKNAVNPLMRDGGVDTASPLTIPRAPSQWNYKHCAVMRDMREILS